MLEDPTEAFIAADRPRGLLLDTMDRHDLERLMRPFFVIMLDSGSHGPTKRWLAEEDHLAQTLGLDRKHKPLRVRIAVRSLATGMRRDSRDIDSTGLEIDEEEDVVRPKVGGPLQGSSSKQILVAENAECPRW